MTNNSSITYLSVKESVPPSGYWDQAFLSDILSQINVESSDRHIFIIPGAYQYDVIPEINEHLNQHSKVLVFITSDEECKFDPSKLSHPDMIIYSQYGNHGIPLPIGYSPATREVEPLEEKDLDFFFSGQITHPRRQLLKEALVKLNQNGRAIFTNGFAKGLDQKEYLKNLSRAKFAPCSPGPVAQDSFRIYEALEMGVTPIIDNVSALTSSKTQFFDNLFAHYQPIQFSNYDRLSELLDLGLSYELINQRTLADWIVEKFLLKESIKNKLGIKSHDTIVTIPVSPIKSHPDTSMLEETIRSIRYHTDAPIMITFDGIRREQVHLKEQYHSFIMKMLHKINREYSDILPFIMFRHEHQIGMLRYVLKRINHKYIMYVEHDTPFTRDPIDWDSVYKMLDEEAKIIRFHFEATIPEEHRYLMIGTPSNNFQKTFQWSQRPHIATTEIYRLISSLFTDKANCFIEDFIHGVIQNAINEDPNNWNNWKLWIYHPNGSIKRTYHLDGRQNDKKFDNDQTW